MTLVSDLKALLALAADQDFSKGPLSVEIKRPGKKRSLSANGLYHMWLKQLADHFSKKAGPYCSDEMHDLMKHQFLGYEDRLIGKTMIGHQLRSTANLDTPEFSEYMSKIEAWAADHGCLVTIPAHSHYAEWLEGKR